MGVDRRVGKMGCNNRYQVFKPNTDVRNASVIKNECVGILHAKDGSAYDTSNQQFVNSFERENTRATLISYDSIKIGTDYLLYSIKSKEWFRVESVSENSVNISERWSSRPIIEKRIVIVKATGDKIWS